MLQFGNSQSHVVRPMGRTTARTLTDDQMQSVSGGDDMDTREDGDTISGKLTKVHASYTVDFEDGTISD